MFLLQKPTIPIRLAPSMSMATGSENWPKGLASPITTAMAAGARKNDEIKQATEQTFVILFISNLHLLFYQYGLNS
jgi:hypothetical protein